VKEIHVTNLISQFRERQDNTEPMAVDAQILQFIQTYRTEEGLKRYAPLESDEITALVHEYEATKENDDE
jgi:hypothetical protein